MRAPRTFVIGWNKSMLVFCMVLFIILGTALQPIFSNQTAQASGTLTFVDTFAATGTWKTPSDVTAAQIEVWGGGGSGGNAANNNAAGGGGAGGSYVRKNAFTVSPSDAAYTVTVAPTTPTVSGTAGGFSWFKANSTTSATGIAANGGLGGTNVSTRAKGAAVTAVTTGSCTDCDALFAGGNGGAGNNAAAGGGGGGGAGAANNAKGANAVNQTGGTGANGGGSGGTGAANSSGTAPGAIVPGGGGAGGQRRANLTAENGNTGAAGQVQVTYTINDTGPQFVAAGTQGTSLVSGNGNFSVAPGIPTGTTTGDLMILAIAAENTGGTNTYSVSGWTAVPSGVQRNATSPNIQLNLLYKIAGSSESPPTIAVTGTCVTTGCSAYIVTYRNVDTSTPFDVTTTGGTAAAATTLASTSITPTTDLSRIVNFVASGDDNTLGINTNQELGFTARVSGASGNYNADEAIGIADRALNAHAAVNMLTWNQTANGPDIWANLTVALRPLIITVSGNIYSDEGSTAYPCNTTALTIKAAVNGVLNAGTGSCTLSTGAFSLNLDSPPSAGQAITLWISGDASNRGATVTRAAGASSISGIKIYKNFVLVSHEDSGPVTNTDMSKYCGSGCTGNDTDIQYSYSSSNITISSGSALAVYTGKTYTPGGTVTTNATGGNLDVQASATLNGTNNVTVNAGGVTGDGTINMTGGMFLVDGTGNFGGATGWTFNNLTFGDGAGTTTTTATGAGAIAVTGSMTIATNQTLNAGAKTWNLSGTGGGGSTVAHVTSDQGYCQGTTKSGNMAGGGSCGAGAVSQTFTFTPTNANDAVLFAVNCGSATSATAVSLTATGWATTQVGTIVGSTTTGFMALFKAYAPNTSAATFTQTWTTGGDCGSFMNDLIDEYSGADTTNFVDASNSGSGSTGCALSVTPVANNDGLFFACNDTITAVAGGYTKGADDTSGDWSEWKILTGGAGVAQSASFTSSGNFAIWGAAIKPLVSTSPLTVNGTFTASTSTINYQGNGAVTVTALTGGNAYNNLTLSPTISGSTTYTMGSGTTTVGGNMDINPNGSGGSKTLTVNMAGALSITGSLTIEKSGTAGSTLETTSSNYALSATGITISSGAILNAHASTVTDNGSWTNNAGNGNFTSSGAGSVVMATTATATISGATTFNNFSVSGLSGAKTLNFQHGVIFVFTNAPTLAGSSGKVLTINSDDNTNQWLAHFSAAASPTWVAVTHSGCDTGTANATVDANSTIDGTDGTCWVAGGAASIAVSGVGSATAAMAIPSTTNYGGGYFQMLRGTGTANVTSIKFTKSGTVADANVTNFTVKYSTTCQTTSIPGGASTFGTGTISSGTVTVSNAGVAVGTTAVCFYLQFDISSSATNAQTVAIAIANPSTDVTASAGTVTPSSSIAPSGSTTLNLQITVSTVGTQTGSIPIPSTAAFVGGAFTLTRSSGSTTVTTVNVTIGGTGAAADFANMKVYTDTVASCTTTSGFSTQYGSTVVSPAAGSNAFTGSVTVGTTPVCLYVVVDITSGAGAGDTFELSVNASTDVTAAAGTIVGTFPVSITGTTVLGTASINKVGSSLSGTWADGTGSPLQSHLIYAENAGVWWLFSLVSSGDTFDNHVIKNYYSSGPDLTTATWTAATDLVFSSDHGTTQVAGSGRSLAVLYLKNGTTDAVHLRIEIAQDGQNGDSGHIRGVLGATSVTWGSWVSIVTASASQWKGPTGSGASSCSTCAGWGPALAASSGGYIHSFGTAQDYELDASAIRSTTADTTSTWTNNWNINPNCGPAGGGNCSPGTNGGTNNRPPAFTYDGTMTFESKTGSFAPLANDVMLAINSNGGVAQPNLNNINSQLSGANGGTTMWVDQPGTSLCNSCTQGIFSGNVTIDQNDWTFVPVSTSTIYAFRKDGTAVDGVSYSVGGNSWSAMSAQPPAFGGGQAFKAGGGILGATDGTNVWLAVINTDTANSILYTKFNGTSWSAWAAVTGTNVGTHTRKYLSGNRVITSNGYWGLIWTEGSTNYDTYATSFNVNPQITVSGTVYSDEGTTAYNNSGPCNGTQDIRIRVNGTTQNLTTTCASGGTYTKSISAPSAGQVITVYLDNNAVNATFVDTYVSGNVTADLYNNRVIIGTVTNANLAVWDGSAANENDGVDGDLGFTVVSGALTVSNTRELHVLAGKTFTPGGTVTINPGGTSPLGDLHIAAGATVAVAANALSLGSGFINAGTFTCTGGSQTTTFTATTSGNTITSNGTSFCAVTFNGSGGWAPSDAMTLANASDLTMTAGTLSGTQNITVHTNVLGTAGIISLTGGIFEVRSTGANFGTTSGATNWTFNDLTFSNSAGMPSPATFTTQTGGSGSITVSGTLTLGKAGDSSTTTLVMANRSWVLAGTTGTPLVLTTGKGAITTTNTSGEIQFTGNNAGGDTTIPATTYNKLTLGGASAENYTIAATTVTVNDNLTVNANGTLIGTGTMTVKKDVTGAGTINLTGGTFTQSLGANQNFGTSSGSNNWTFANLTFTNGSGTTTVTTSSGTGTITVTGTLTVTAAVLTNLDAGNRTWILSSTGTPFALSASFGALIGNASTFQYTGNGATTTASTGYNNLSLLSSGATATVIGTGSYTIAGNLIVGASGGGADASGANPTITVTGNVTIASGTFTSTSGTLSIGGNFTNNSTFAPNGGTIVFTGAGIHTVSGSSSTTFHNMTDTTDASTIKFKNDAGGVTPLYTFDTSGVLTVTGGASKITITSDTGVTNPWLVHFTTTQTAVTNAIISWSDCDATSAGVTLDSTSTDNGNNNVTHTCWNFFVPHVLIQGNVYSDDATTVPSFCDGSTTTVKVRFNGVSYGPNACASGTGVFSITGPASAPGAGTIMYVWVGGATCGANNATGSCGTTLVRYSGSSNITAVKLRVGRLVLRSDSGNLTDTDLSGWTNTDDPDVVYSATSGSLTVEDQIKLVVDTGTFAPTGTVTTDTASSSGITDGDLTISSGATMSVGTNAVSIGGDFTNAGTFTKSSGQTTTFTATGSGFTITSNAANGDLDAVTFNGSGGVWTTQDAFVADGALTITAGNFTVGAFNLTVTGATSVSGTLTLSSSTGTKTFTNDVTINSGGVWNNSGNAAVALAGSLTHSGTTFTAGSGVYTMSGTGKTITGTIAIPSLTISGTTTNNGTLTVSTALAGASTLTNGNSATLNVAGATPLSGGTLTASGTSNTVNYTSASQTCKTTNYVNLTVSGSGTFTCAATTVTGNLVMSGTESWSLGADLVVTGTASVGSGTTVSGTHSLTVNGGSLTGSGTVNLTGGTLTLAGTGNFGSSTAWTVSNLTLSGTTTATGSGGVTVSGQMNISASSSLNAGSQTWTLNASGASGARPLVVSASGSFTPATSTVDYEGTSATDVESTNTTYNNLKVGTTSDGSAGVTYTLNGSTTVGGLLTVGNASSTNSDTLALGSTTLTLSGNGTPLTVTSKGTLSAASATVNYTNVTGGQTITMAPGTFANIGAGTVSDSASANTFTLGGDTTVSAVFTVGNASSTNSDSLSGSTFTLTLSGTGTPLNLTSKGSFTASTSTVNYTNTTGGQTITLAPATYNILGVGTVSDANAANIFTLGGNTTAATLNVGNASSTNSDALDGSTFTLTLSGTGTPLNLTSKGTFTASTSTVAYTGAGADNIAQTTYKNLTLNNASGTFVIPAGGVTLRGNMLLTAATAVTKGGTVVFGIGGGNSQTYTDSTAGMDIGAVQISANSGISTLSLSSNVTFTSVIVDGSQVLTTNANTVTLTGASSIITGNFTPSSGSTIAYVPSQASGTVTLPSGITYYNVKFNKSSNTFTAASGTMPVSNNFDVTAGTLDLNTNDPAVTVGGTTTIGGTLSASNTANFTIKGDWTNNGTFTHNSGTVVADFSSIPTQGTLNITGTATPQTFNNFTASTATGGKTLKFKSGSTFVFAGTATLTGLASAPLKIAAITPTSQWIATLSGSASVGFLSVVDSGCSGGNNFTSATTADSVFNLGNNGSCWGFVSRSGGSAIGSTANGGGSGGGSGNNSCSSNCNSSGTVTGSGGGNPAGTINIDASTPVRFEGTPADNINITSASFTPPANSLLLALVNADTAAATSITISVSSSPSLTWTKIAQSDYAATGVAGHSSAWYAVQPSSQGMTVSAKRTSTGGSTNEISVKVYVITGYNTTTPIGANNNGSSATNSISPTIYTSTADNSVGFGVGTDKNNLGLPTSTDTYDSANYSNSVSAISAVKGAPTSLTGTGVTMNFDAAGTSPAAWNWVGFEVKPFVASQGGGGGGGSP